MYKPYETIQFDIISDAIKKMISETGITPNTIRIHPKDLIKLRSREYYNLKVKPSEILGLKIIETIKVDEGKAEIYNDEYFEIVDYSGLVVK